MSPAASRAGSRTPMAQIPFHPAKAAVRTSVLGALGLLLAGLPGCQSIDVGTSNMAQVRIIDASPDAPGLDIYQNNSAVAYNLGFGTVTSYIPLAPGAYTISANSAGTKQALISAKQTLTAGRQYTAIIGNVAASLQETILTDQISPAPTGQISVRVIDQATRVGAVDLYLIPSSGKLTTTSPFLTNINFNSNSGYINIPAGTYAIAVVPTGTVPISTTVTLLTGAQLGYSAGSVRTVVLIDQQIVTSPGVQAIVADDYDSPSAT